MYRVSREGATDGASAVGYTEGCVLRLSLVSALLYGKPSSRARTLRELESPVPNVVCVPQAPVLQSCPMTHVLLAAESRSRWYSSLLSPMVTATM